MYSPDMMESVSKAVATREQRLKETFPTLSPDDKSALLNRYHPDFVPGAMRELGVSARQLHKEVGRAAVAQGVDGLFGVGYWGYFIVAGANDDPGDTVTMGIRNLDDAARWLIEYVQPGDTVLFKASRAVGFGRLVRSFIAGRVISDN